MPSRITTCRCRGTPLKPSYDLQSGRYLALGMKNEEKRAYDFGFSASKADFQPAALRQSGIR
jgi:Protein of unknown function (DUF1329).